MTGLANPLIVADSKNTERFLKKYPFLSDAEAANVLATEMGWTVDYARVMIEFVRAF